MEVRASVLTWIISGPDAGDAPTRLPACHARAGGSLLNPACHPALRSLATGLTLLLQVPRLTWERASGNRYDYEDIGFFHRGALTDGA